MEMEIIGNAYREVIRQVKNYAKKDYPVLLYGETGSGKEVFKELFFESSDRKIKMTVNCAAFAPALLESELFGHVRGAFTGATEVRMGKIKSCEGGILCLDELGAASPELQAAILRVVEGHHYTPLGTEKEVETHALIIASTNNLAVIRQDLKFRFHLVPIPPLQKYDIPLFVKHFIRKSLKEEILEEVMDRDYPGNIRELEKHLKELLIERGKTILAPKASTSSIPGFFDYPRFKREIETWDARIQPILDKYELNFRYRFLSQERQKKAFPLPPHSIETLVWGSLVDAKTMENLDPQRLNCLLRFKLAKDPNWIPGLYKLLDLLNQGIETNIDGTVKYVPYFVGRFTELLESQGGLPYLLKYIQKTSSRSKMESPDWTHFLNLSHKKAVSAFELFYLEYHLKKSGNKMKDAAKAVGVPERTFRSALNRARKKG
jgi:DNA-binding NtrC family response regulator